jgi:nucleotide-binding universal stress UspA family protein
VVELAPPAVETPLLRGEFAEEMKEQKGMDVTVLARHAIAGIEAGKLEIRPGLSQRAEGDEQDRTPIHAQADGQDGEAETSVRATNEEGFDLIVIGVRGLGFAKSIDSLQPSATRAVGVREDCGHLLIGCRAEATRFYCAAFGSSAGLK